MAKSNPLVKTIDLQGEGRDAQNLAQEAVAREFMNPEILPRYRLMVNFATGVGKGKAAIETACQFYDKISRKQVLIGCYTENQRDKVWATQLATWGRMHPIMDNNRRECYASFRKIKGCHFGIVILDEVHRMAEEDYVFFQNNTFEAILILTATQPKNPAKRALIHQLTAGRRLIVRNQSAIEAKILNDFKVHVMWVDLDDEKKYKLFKTNNQLFTDRSGYLKKCSIYQQAKNSGDRIRIRFAGLDRKRFLGDTQTKTKATIYIQDQIRKKGYRFITIANSIDQTDKLGLYTAHSKRNKDHYNAFLRGEINELISVEQLKEGENFDNLGRMVITQPSGDPYDFEQTKGRAQRLKPGETSIIYLVAARDTMDETWVKNMLKYTDESKIKYFNLDRELYWPTKEHLTI